MGARESLREAIVLGVDDEIDVALAVQRDILRAMTRYRRQSHGLKETAQVFGIGRGVLNEFKAVGAHGICGVHRHLAKLPPYFNTNSDK